MTPYEEAFPVGSSVRIVDLAALETFKATWAYHHKLQPEQLEYAGQTTSVKAVAFYHGGDVLYELDNIPGYWHGSCLVAG